MKWFLRTIAWTTALPALLFLWFFSAVLWPCALVVFGGLALVFWNDLNGWGTRITASAAWGRLPWVRRRSLRFVSLALALWALLSAGSGVPLYLTSGNNSHDAANAAPVATSPPTGVPSPTLPYRVSVSGSMPGVQFVGQTVTLRVHIKNTGRDIPNLTLWFDGLGSWTINDVLCACGYGLHPQEASVMGDGNAWAYGPLPHGMKATAAFVLVATKPGNPDLSMSGWTDVDSDGTPSGTQLSAAAIQWQGAIDP